MNKALLKYEMDRNNVTVDDIVEVLGISKSAWYRKISGKTEFTRGEISAIGKLLKLDSLMPIFFAD